jgi:hypothetical protein
MAFRGDPQRASRRCGHCFCLVILLCGGISALSNLDVSEPIARASPARDQDNFGFAVVLHQVELPETGNFGSFINSTRWVLPAVVTWYCPVSPSYIIGGLVLRCMCVDDSLARHPFQEKYGQPPIPISFSPPESGGAYLTCIAYGVGVV